MSEDEKWAEREHCERVAKEWVTTVMAANKFGGYSEGLVTLLLRTRAEATLTAYERGKREAESKTGEIAQAAATLQRNVDTVAHDMVVKQRDDLRVALEILKEELEIKQKEANDYRDLVRKVTS